MTILDILQLGPAAIQKYLDDALANSPDQVKAVIERVDYVEPGTLRAPECEHGIALFNYASNEKIEVAIKVRPGAVFVVDLLLKML